MDRHCRENERLVRGMSINSPERHGDPKLNLAPRSEKIAATHPTCPAHNPKKSLFTKTTQRLRACFHKVSIGAAEYKDIENEH